MDVEYADAHMSATSASMFGSSMGGIKRAGGFVHSGGKKKSRFTVTDLLPDDDQGKLKWRGDPADTHSDWTIEVVFEGPVVVSAAPAPAPEIAGSSDAAVPPSGDATMEEGAGADAVEPPLKKAAPNPEVIEIQTQTKTYHVHRYLLGFGTRRSEYFAKLFKAAGSDDRKTRFELEPLAAAAFPDLLDFLYDPRGPLVVDTETATAVHHLGIKLEMTHLMHYSMKFIETDLALDTLQTYYQHAKLFQDQTILDMIVQFIGKNITAISTTPATVGFVQETDAQLWKSALEHVSPNPNNFATDLHISKLISQFAAANKDSLDATTFQELTAETKLRKIDPAVAWTLCELDDDVASRHAVVSAEGEDGTQLSSLQQRCATALSENWKRIDVSGEQVKTRKTAFLVDLLGKCLSEAKAENENITSSAKKVARRTDARRR